MALVLVSDTSVLIDLDRGGMLGPALSLPYDFAVPDLLFERELASWASAELRNQIVVLSLDSAGVALAARYRRVQPRLSLPDAFAMALAKLGHHMLLAGDAALRAMATAEGLECHGVLWVLDEIELHGLVSGDELHAALTTIARHPRCRLPGAEIRWRLEQWGWGRTPGGREPGVDGSPLVVR